MVPCHTTRDGYLVTAMGSADARALQANLTQVIRPPASPTDQACSNPGTNAAFRAGTSKSPSPSPGPTKGMCSTRAAWVVPQPNLHRSLSPPPSCTPTFRAPNTTLSSAGSQANAPRPAPVPAGTTQGQTPPPAAVRLRLIVSIEKDKANPTREVASQSA
ncbi:hypothetical protein AX14_014428, partial [Amanita brunnescens Koide BX004]